MPENHGEHLLSSLHTPGGHGIILDNRTGLAPADDVLITLARRGTAEGYTVYSDEMAEDLPTLEKVPTLHICVLLRPGPRIAETSRIRILAAVAAAHAIERNGTVARAGIRWMGDLYAEQRRIAAVRIKNFLLPSGYPDFMMLHTAVEMSPRLFPPRLSDVVTQVFSGKQVTMADHIVQAMMREFFSMYEQFDASAKYALKEYRSRSLLLGKRVFVNLHGKRLLCRAVQIDDNGALVVEHRKQTDVLTAQSQLI